MLISERELSKTIKKYLRPTERIEIYQDGSGVVYDTQVEVENIWFNSLSELMFKLQNLKIERIVT